MFSFFKSKRLPGSVGLEVRADGLAIAVLRPTDKASESTAIEYAYRACSAAERESVLAELITHYHLEGMACHVVLPIDQYQTYPIDKPKVEASELADASRWRIKDMLDYDLESAVTDVYEFPADAVRGRPEQLNVVVCRKVLIEDCVHFIEQSSLELESIDIADLALRNLATQQSDSSERAAAILYLRHGSGSMVVVKGGLLYLARHFDFSLQSLNEPSQQDSVIQHLALEVQRSFDYFESQLGQHPPQKLTLIGPDPNIPLANMLGGGIAAKVEQFDVSTLSKDAEPISTDLINAFVALGAALRPEGGA